MRLISRVAWGARHGRGYPTDGAKTLVVVHHDGVFPSRSQPGMMLEQEVAIMRLIEQFHASGLTVANPRIGYTAAGMQTGRVFEGCGWGYVGAHTAGMNSSSYGYFMPLDGSRNAPTADALESFHEWRAEGVTIGALSPRHIVKGHQDYNKPSCPGRLVYDAAVLGITDAAVVTVADIVRAHPTLREGKGGLYATAAERESVKYLQTKLGMEQQYRTGYFGPITARAVRAFQHSRSLKIDAIVGARTWAALER